MKSQIKKAATGAKRAGKKIARKATPKKAHATASSVRSKAKRVVAKIKHVEQGAENVARRIGATMETIGGAIVSLVEPDGTPRRGAGSR